jgi:hypothetical protein
MRRDDVLSANALTYHCIGHETPGSNRLRAAAGGEQTKIIYAGTASS